ncbi:MAG: hypothetical protein COA67_03670 [Lutibacter sp.]|nr:MAG: hypothetical protein COA67_03670 [Lutibacter sp.]
MIIIFVVLYGLKSSFWFGINDLYKNTMKTFIFFSKKFELWVLSFLMFFTFFAVNKLTLFIVVLVLFIIIFKRNFFLKNTKTIGIKPILFLCSWYLFSIITFFWSENTGDYTKIVIRDSAFLIFPVLIIYGIDFLSKKRIEFLLYIFILGVLIQLFIFYIGLNDGVNHSTNENLSIFNFYSNFNRFLKYTPNELLGLYKWQVDRPFLHIHKAYLSIQCLIGIVFLLYKLPKLSSKSVLLLLFSVFLVFNGVIVFLFSIPNLILLFLFYFVFIVRFLKKRPLLTFAFLSVFITSIVYYSTTGSGEKYISFQTKKITNLISTIKNQSNLIEYNKFNNSRLRSYYCAVTSIKKRPFFGYGLGDTKDVLVDCYEEKIFLTEFKERHNTHNYYLDRLLSGGFVMLFLFLLFFVYCYKIGFQKKSKLYLLFLTIFLVNLLFENVFSRVQGIFTFSILNSLFLNFLIKKPES